MHARIGGKSDITLFGMVSEQAYGLKREARPAAGGSALGRGSLLEVKYLRSRAGYVLV